MNMTNEQAKFINERAFLVDAFGNTDEYLIEANKMSISALEKQIPKAVEIGEQGSHEFVYCPTCGKNIVYMGHVKYCKHCGQRIVLEVE